MCIPSSTRTDVANLSQHVTVVLARQDRNEARSVTLPSCAVAGSTIPTVELGAQKQILPRPLSVIRRLGKQTQVERNVGDFL